MSSTLRAGANLLTLEQAQLIRTQAASLYGPAAPDFDFTSDVRDLTSAAALSASQRNRPLTQAELDGLVRPMTPGRSWDSKIVGTALASGLDIGINTSGGLTSWLAPEPPRPAPGDLRMVCPGGQAWCAMFVTSGPAISTFPRPGIDLSGYQTLTVEIEGDPGTTIQVGFKGATQPDYRPELRSYRIGESILTVAAPRRIEIYRTSPLSARLIAPPSGCQLEAHLESPSFDISPTESVGTAVSGGILDFDWLVAPKRVGEHVIMLWIESRCGIGTMSRATRGRAQGPVMIPISVVNEFGFSASSEAILKGITGVLGIIALICGLPFLKRVFERRADQSAS